jgi:hypothetical protein
VLRFYNRTRQYRYALLSIQKRDRNDVIAPYLFARDRARHYSSLFLELDHCADISRYTN